MENYWRPARLTPGLESPEFARESGFGTGINRLPTVRYLLSADRNKLKS